MRRNFSSRTGRPGLFAGVLSTILFVLFTAGIQAQTEPDSPQVNPAETESKDSADSKDKTEKDDDQVVDQQLDEVSITATRVQRKTQDVPASMSVVGKEKIEDAKMHNIKDALSGTPGVQVESKNGGYDSRLIIRGAGVKARYGIREIMILLNGVPITDPDGFSKLDMIDPQQIERIEVVKGPNSTLWGANAAGGVINIITKSPLTQQGGFVKIGAGNFGEKNSAFSYANNVNNFFMYSVSGSYIASDNTWRERNKYSAYNAAFQPTFVFDDGTTWENYFSYNKSDLQLPGTVDEVLFADYERTGNLKINDQRKALLRILDGIMQTEINPYTREQPWKYSGRYSTSGFASSKLTKKIGNFTIKPLVYGNRWTHNHPVTGSISDSKSTVYGGDLQIDWKHPYGLLTVGGMGRMDRQEGKRYEYRDYLLSTSRYSPRITAITSDAEGNLSATSSDSTRLLGAYIQESLNPTDKLIVDLGVRYDEIKFKLKGDVDSFYDWSKGNYTTCTDAMIDCGQPVLYGKYNIRKIYEAASPRIGISYRVFKPLSVYANVARGIQTPTSGEISSNPDLKLVKYTNYEAGIKGRGTNWTFDINAYKGVVGNEVVPKLNIYGKTEYSNAGRTHKDGYEIEAAYIFADVLSIGGSYTRTKYRYKYFMEVGTDPKTYRPVENDRGGKTLPYIPAHQYAAFIQYKGKSGFKTRIQVETWSSFYVDTANSEKYQGIKNVTSLMLGYNISDKLDFTINVHNLFNRRYAVEVQKDPSRGKYYSVAPPRNISVALSARF